MSGERDATSSVAFMPARFVRAVRALTRREALVGLVGGVVTSAVIVAGFGVGLLRSGRRSPRVFASVVPLTRSELYRDHDLAG